MQNLKQQSFHLPEYLGMLSGFATFHQLCDQVHTIIAAGAYRRMFPCCFHLSSITVIPKKALTGRLKKVSVRSSQSSETVLKAKRTLNLCC